jgi:drug/metabolite transporter (DMT)-like permease
MQRRQELAGLGFAALCVLTGAFVPAFAKLTTGRADALSVAALTNLFAGATAAAWLGARGQLGRLVERRVAPRLALVGALGTAATALLFFEGASRTSATDVVLCLQVEPAYSLVLARVFLGHPISARRLGAVALLLAGIALALESRGAGASLGAALLLATPLCWQVSHLVVLRGLAGVPPPVLTGARYVYGGALVALPWLAGGGFALRPPPGEAAPLLAALAAQGIVLSFAGTLLWYQTLARLDLARATAIVVPSIPLLSMGANFLLLGEVASARQWTGLALVALGVTAFVTAPHPRLPRERIPSAVAPIAVEPDPPGPSRSR